MDKLTTQQVKERLDSLTGWELVDDKLHKDFEFTDFNQAFDFMRHVAEVAERLQHHPDWSNSYSRVSINLTSHEVGGLTEVDFNLAREINKVTS